jgi:DNA-binding Xre family transcriptional regulator
MITIRLAAIAESQGKNMSQIQRESGLTMGMIRRYWNNQTADVRLSSIETLCHLLNVDVCDMLAMNEPKE